MQLVSGESCQPGHRDILHCGNHKILEIINHVLRQNPQSRKTLILGSTKTLCCENPWCQFYQRVTDNSGVAVFPPSSPICLARRNFYHPLYFFLYIFLEQWTKINPYLYTVQTFHKQNYCQLFKKDLSLKVARKILNSYPTFRQSCTHNLKITPFAAKMCFLYSYKVFYYHAVWHYSKYYCTSWNEKFILQKDWSGPTFKQIKPHRVKSCIFISSLNQLLRSLFEKSLRK